MIWNNYSGLTGKHSFLSPSNYHWLNYDNAQLFEKWSNHQNAVLGTRLHAFAQKCIELKRRQPDTQDPLNQFVNDALGFGMSPEVILLYSENAFGTADAIYFDEREMVLRIHDLKTGVSEGNVKQLLIYAALFCLEYGYNPKDLKHVELRIYHKRIITYVPTPEDILDVMQNIRNKDALIKEWTTP